MTTATRVRRTTRRRHHNDLDVIRAIAGDLSANLAPTDRYQRLVDALIRMVPADSAVLLRIDGDALIPVATAGLVPEAMARRMTITEHPRFAQILRGDGPVRFETSKLPDPFDGLLAADPGGCLDVHACLGCRLMIEDVVVGVLALDALDATAFRDITDELVATVAALAAAAFRTATVVGVLEREAARSDLVARQLIREAEVERGEIIGVSPTCRALRAEIALAAQTDLAVLITGETGVGKELVARAIHDAGARSARPLIHVNCAAIPESITESELFGHVRGAFTGAVDHRAGKFEVADGGTLFLDEIGELPLAVQPKLLRALESGEIQRVGSDRAIVVDVRIIAATNRDLVAEVAAGRFRPDLFHRLAVYPVAVAPLRSRGEDVAILAGYFLDQARTRLGLGPVRMSPAARAAVLASDWPGNVRELQHTVLRAALRAAAGTRRAPVLVDAIHLELAPVARAEHVPDELDALPLDQAVDALKRRRIQLAVTASGGNWSDAARRLGVDRGNLHRVAQRLGMLEGDDRAVRAAPSA
jgi:anaerobic nitric oxide reductase transcription regulator